MAICFTGPGKLITYVNKQPCLYEWKNPWHWDDGSKKGCWLRTHALRFGLKFFVPWAILGLFFSMEM